MRRKELIAAEFDFNVSKKTFPSFYFSEKLSLVYGDDVICIDCRHITRVKNGGQNFGIPKFEEID